MIVMFSAAAHFPHKSPIAQHYGRTTLGRFRWWPQEGANPAHPLDAHELQLLLWNGDPTSANTAPLWRRIAVAA